MGSDKLFDELTKNTRNFFSELEKENFDFSKLKKIDLGRTIVKKRFNLTEEQISAVEFVYWISYYAETEIREMILEIEKIKTGKDNPVIDSFLDNLNFTDKILILEKNYALNDSDKPFIKILWKIKDFRNDVAHGKFDKLVYDKYPFSDPRGQLILIADIMNAAKNK